MCKFCDIEWNPNFCKLGTDRIMGGIGDMFVDIAMTERLITSINVRYVNFNAMESKTIHSVITPEEVYLKFNIGIDKAKKTLIVATWKGIRYAVHRFHRRYRVGYMKLNRKRINTQFYTDRLFSKTKSLEDNTGAWIYTTVKFTVVYLCTFFQK